MSTLKKAKRRKKRKRRRRLLLLWWHGFVKGLEFRLHALGLGIFGRFAQNVSVPWRIPTTKHRLIPLCGKGP